MATFVTVQAGDWNDSSTWGQDTVPGATDTVWITEPVTFHTNIIAKNILIFPGGSLTVDETGNSLPVPGTASFERMTLCRTLNDTRRVNLDGILLIPERVQPTLSCYKVTHDADAFPVINTLIDNGDGNVIIDDPGFLSSSAILRDIKPEGCSQAYAEKVSNAVRYITVTIHIKATDMHPMMSLYRMAKGPFQVLLVTHSCVIKGFIESMVPDPASVGKEYITVKVTITEGPGA